MHDLYKLCVSSYDSIPPAHDLVEDVNRCEELDRDAEARADDAHLDENARHEEEDEEGRREDAINEKARHDAEILDEEARDEILDEEARDAAGEGT
jgi:hypothetical protein